MHDLHRNRESPRRDAPALRSRSPLRPADSGERSAGNSIPLVTDADDLLTRIMRMPLDEREVLVLVAVEGLSYAEIAALLGVSIATVMATLDPRAEECVAPRRRRRRRRPPLR